MTGRDRRARRFTVGLGLATMAVAGAAVPVRAGTPALQVAPALPSLAAPSITSTSPFLPAPAGGVPSVPAAPPIPGQDLAFGAFQRGYFATALNEAMKRLQADPKDGPAMALVGEIYAQGLAVRRDLAEAAKWDQLASQQGNREGTFAYALALVQGSGVAKDKVAAKALFEKAAAQGHAGALYNLGVLALEGDGKTSNFGVAAAFFRRAADAGDIDALEALASLYRSGLGVMADDGKAADLLRQAADQRHVGAELEFAIMLFNGEGVPKDETRAARYFTMAAYGGNPVAANRLGRLYAAGRGVAKNPVEAARWHILARAAGIADPWLDTQLALLSPGDKAKVEDEIRRQLGQ